MDIKALITRELSEQLANALELTGGMKTLFGDPVAFNGREIVAVGRITIKLTAEAEGLGHGNTYGMPSGMKNLAKGSGGGSATSGVQVTVEPVGYLSVDSNGTKFVLLENISRP